MECWYSEAVSKRLLYTGYLARPSPSSSAHQAQLDDSVGGQLTAYHLPRRRAPAVAVAVAVAVTVAVVVQISVTVTAVQSVCTATTAVEVAEGLKEPDTAVETPSSANRPPPITDEVGSSGTELVLPASRAITTEGVTSADVCAVSPPEEEVGSPAPAEDWGAADPVEVPSTAWVEPTFDIVGEALTVASSPPEAVGWESEEVTAEV